MAVFDDFFGDVQISNIYNSHEMGEKGSNSKKTKKQPESSDDIQMHEPKQAKKAGCGELIQVSEANSYKVGPY